MSTVIDFYILQVYYLLLAIIIIRLAYGVYFYLCLSLYKGGSKDKFSSKSLSCIVCYHNESDIIHDTVKSLLDQDYKELELVLVDDRSTDNSLELLKEMQSKSIQIIENRNSSDGKKLALSKGIQAAKHDWLLLTDADCSMDSSWVTTMAKYSIDNKIVLGFAPLRKSSSWIAKFARYETYYTAIQYLSYALAGLPYMGVGRNLMYHRSVYDKAGGFNSHTDIASGDDDLLINVAANRKNTTICIEPKSFVYSDAKDTFRSFIRQKTRHISSSHRYRLIHKLLLGLSSMVHIMMYILAFILILKGTFGAMIALIMYWIIMMIIQFPICRKLDSMDLWLLYPVYDILMAAYYIIMIPFTFTKKQSTWS